MRTGWPARRAKPPKLGPRPGWPLPHTRVLLRPLSRAGDRGQQGVVGRELGFTNFLGQNTPAIAATEAHYMEMWFQDGLSMDTYAATSQQAVALPQQTPAPATSDGGLSSDLAAAAQSIQNSITTTLNNLSTTLQGLLSGNSTGNHQSTNGLSSALSSAVTNLTGASSTAHTAATSATSTAATATTATTATGSILPFKARITRPCSPACRPRC